MQYSYDNKLKFSNQLLESVEYENWHHKLYKATDSTFWDYPTLNICYPELARELEQLAEKFKD